MFFTRKGANDPMCFNGAKWSFIRDTGWAFMLLFMMEGSPVKKPAEIGSVYHVLEGFLTIPVGE